MARAQQFGLDKKPTNAEVEPGSQYRHRGDSDGGDGIWSARPYKQRSAVRSRHRPLGNRRRALIEGGRATARRGGPPPLAMAYGQIMSPRTSSSFRVDS